MQSSQSCKTDLFLSITNLSFYSSKFDILHQSTTFKKLERFLRRQIEIKIQPSLSTVVLGCVSIFYLMLFSLCCICFNVEPTGSADLSGKKLSGPGPKPSVPNPLIPKPKPRGLGLTLNCSRPPPTTTHHHP